MRYKVEKKPSNTKGDTWSVASMRKMYYEEFNRHISDPKAEDLALFLKLFWVALKEESTYLNDVNIWNLTQQKRRDIFLRGHQMWIMYKTSIDLNKPI